MTQETRTIAIKVYRTPEGKPTCAINVGKLQSCEFLSMPVYGQFRCSRHGYPDDYNDSRGFFKPHAHCELWKGQA